MARPDSPVVTPTLGQRLTIQAVFEAGLTAQGSNRRLKGMEIEYTTRVHREGTLYVAHAQELDVSSAGGTVDESRAHLSEAVGLFLEEAERLGTLIEILEEAGYVKQGDRWQPPDIVSTERSRLAVPLAAR